MPRNHDLGNSGLNRNNPRLVRRLVDDPQESKVVFESLGVGPIELEDIGLAQGGAPLVPSAQGTREYQPVALNGETPRPANSGAIGAVGEELERLPVLGVEPLACQGFRRVRGSRGVRFLPRIRIFKAFTRRTDREG